MFKIIRLLAAVNILVFSMVCSFHAQAERKQSQEKRDAEQAWEALIKMKGGREKLYSITSMLYVLNPSKPEMVQLDVLPGKVWHFVFDWGGRPLVTMSDAGIPIEYLANEHGVYATDKEVATEWYSLQRVIYLLETRYDKPEPFRVSRRKIGNKKFDVIEAKLGNQRIDFIYEPEEMLALRVVTYFDNGRVLETYVFSDFTEIDGIKMPHKQNINLGNETGNYFYSIGFAFNVDYNPDLFTRPLKATTPDAWKPKKKN